MNVIETRNLKKTFGEIEALDDISFYVKSGEIYGLVGPDGAGKTTLMRILVGIMSADSGSALIDGYDVLNNPEAVKRKIGYMSQRFSLYGDLTVAENLEFYADLYEITIKDRKKRIKRLLEFSRLEPFLGRRADALSGGMKQKLGLSCALIHTPNILFLDEPTTGVDPVSRRELWMILYELWKEGMTIFVSTPYMDEAERCGRVGFIHRGRIISEGTPTELKRNTDFSVIEVKITDVINARKKIEQSELFSSFNIFGEYLHFLSKNYREDMKEVQKNLKSLNIKITKASKVDASLEDIFLYLTSDKLTDN